MANGTSITPPMASCQPAKTSGGAGEPQRFSRTVATAIMAVAANAAPTPMRSSPCALGPRMSASPRITLAAAASVCAIGFWARIPQASPITKTGWAAPIIEATLPGRWYAARNKSGKNAPKFRVARIVVFHHQSPFGSFRLNRTISRPIGSDRMTESSSGRSGGKIAVVRRKLVPHTRGAMAVTRISVRRRISSP